MLELESVGKRVGPDEHISDVTMTLEAGTLNVLLGPTLAGKTSLMRLMAGLDKPTSGEIRFNGENVVGKRVQDRNVAMVYQQFINYPALTVYENIASPLKIAGHDKATIDREVRAAAELLRLEPYLERTPLHLSGGQQQRTALARAIVKKADLVLLDEPLANLDYKLREELRDELPKVFKESGAIFVYATTEPTEALLLGGNTATLHQGRVTQFGATVDVFRQPVDLITAKTFSDPPLNIIGSTKRGGRFILEGEAEIDAPAMYQGLPDGPCIVGFRPHHLSLSADSEHAVHLKARVSVTEITGSESYIHLDHGGERWALLTPGIHDIETDADIDIYLDTRHLLIFDQDGQSLDPAISRAAA
ncbi:MAG: ABC transporter ATP-binding protein [Magnetovibrionaceae bacterium]